MQLVKKANKYNTLIWCIPQNCTKNNVFFEQLFFLKYISFRQVFVVPSKPGSHEISASSSRIR